MTPRKGNDAGFARDVGQILTAAEVGLRWADNIGPTMTIRYLAARMPLRVAVASSAPPLSVVVLRAKNRATSALESGCRVVWRMPPATIGRSRAPEIEITAIDVSDTAAEYDVTIGVLQE